MATRAAWLAAMTESLKGLPTELLLLICSHFLDDSAPPKPDTLDPFSVPPSAYSERSLLPFGTSILHEAANRALYRHIVVTSTRRFDRLIRTLRTDPTDIRRIQSLRSKVKILTFDTNSEMCSEQKSRIHQQITELASILPHVKIINIQVSQPTALDARVMSALHRFVGLEELQVTGVMLGVGNVLALLEGFRGLKKVRLSGLKDGFSYRVDNYNTIALPDPSRPPTRTVTSLDISYSILSPVEFVHLTASLSLCTHIGFNHIQRAGNVPVPFPSRELEIPIRAHQATLESLTLVLATPPLHICDPPGHINRYMVGDKLGFALADSPIHTLTIGGQSCLSTPRFFDQLTGGWTSLRTLLLTGCAYDSRNQHGISPAAFMDSLAKGWTNRITEVILNGMGADDEAGDEMAWDWDTHCDLAQAVEGKFKLTNRAFDHPASRISTRTSRISTRTTSVSAGGTTGRAGKKVKARSKSSSKG